MADKFKWLIAVSMAAVFLLDSLSSQGWSFSRFYLPCILLTYRMNCSRAPFYLAGICTILTAVGIALSAGSGWHDSVLARLPDFVLFWIVAAFVVMMNRSSIEQAKLAADVEQQRVDLAAEKALRESESRYRTFVDHASDALFVHNDRGIVVDANRRACELLGYSKEELIGKSPFEFDSHVSHEFLQGMMKKLQARESVSFESYHRRQDGSLFPVEVRIRPFMVNGDRFALAVARDMTERRQAEDELRASESRFKELSNAIPQIVWTATPDGSFDHLNERATVYLGVQGNEWSDRDWEQAIHPDDLEQARDSWRTIFRTGTPQDIEFRLRRRDGEYRWHISRQVASRDAAGNIVRWYGTCTDIEDRRRTEVALRDSEQRFARFMHHLPGLAWIKDLSGRYVFGNEMWLKRVRSPARSLVGLTDDDLFSPETAQEFRANDRLAIDSQTGIKVIESLRFSDGVTRYSLVSKFPIHAPDGTEPLIGGMAIDITAQHQAETALRMERDRFNTLAATAPGVIYSLRQRTDGTFCFPYVSPVILDVYGLEPTDLAEDASPIFNMLLTEDAEKFLRAIADSAATMNSVREIFRIRHPSKKTISIEMHGTPQRDPDGSVLWNGFVTDVTEREEAKLELERQRADLNLILDSVPALIFYKDTGHRLVRINQEMVRLIGQPRAAIEGKTDEQIGFPNASEYYRDEDEIVASGLPKRGIVEPLHTQSGLRWMQTDKIPSRDEAGNITGVIGFALDITDRKLAEDALAESHARLLSLGNNLPGGAIYQYQRWPDGRKRFIYFTKGLEDRLAISATAIVADANALHSQIDPEDAARLDELECASMGTLQSLMCEFRVRKSNGQIRWIHFRSSPRRETDGSTIWDGVAIDVTDRKQAEAALTAQNQLLEQIATGAPLDQILEQTIRFIEERLPDSLCSINFYNSHTNEFRFGAGRNLPFDFAHSIDGVQADPNVGSCGAAVFRRKPVVVVDTLTDPLWSPLRELAVAYGFRSCWSIPIFSSTRSTGDGDAPRVLGTFGLYKRTVWLPGPEEAQLINGAAWLAGVAIERETAAQSLRESEKRYRDLVELAPDGFVILQQGRVVYANQAAAQLVGIESPEKLIGLVLTDFVHPDDAGTSHARQQSIQAFGESVPLRRFRVRRKDGTWIVMESCAGPCEFNGQTAIQLIARDVSDQNRAEEALRDSRANLANAQRIARLGSWEWDIPNNKLSWSDEVYRLYGITPQESEPTYEKFVNSIHPDDRGFVTAAVQAAITEHRGYDLEYRMIRSDKTEVVMHTQGELTCDERGNALRMSGIVIDITARKRAEQALRESQERLRLIFETVAEGLVVHNSEGRIIECNSEAERILGMTSDQLLGITPLDPQWKLVSANGQPVPGELRPAIAALRTRQQSRDEVMGVHRPDGQLVWISINTAPLFDTHGEISMIVSSFGDITVNKRMQDALKKSEARFSRIFESIPTMMAISTFPEGLLVDQNPFYTKMMGFQPAEARGRTAVDLNIWPDPRQRAMLVAAVQRGDSVRGAECVIRAKSGRLYTVMVSVEPIEFGGEPCLLFIHHDITERKLVEESLRESEERYRSLIESAPAGLYVNLNNRFAYVNQATCRLLGAKSKEELLGTPIFDRFPPEVHAVIQGRIERVRQHGESVPLLEHAYLRLDGSQVHVETMAIPIQFDHQPAVQVLINDITERKEAEERLQATEKRLATVFRSSPVGICVSTMEEGRVIDVNDVYAHMAGYTREEVVGRRTIDFGQWLEPADRTRLVHELKQEGSIKNWEIAFRRKDGSIGHSLRSFERLTLDDEDCILTMVSDVTDRKRIDEELRTSRQRLEVLSRQLITTQETERRHLARELHDEIGQVFTAIKMKLRQTQRAADPSLQPHLEENLSMVDQAISRVRNLSLSLRPPQLDDLGLVAALHWFVKHQARIGGFQENLVVDLGDVNVSTDLATVCFRITQEALTNAVRHGSPQNIHVELRVTNSGLNLTIQDDGVGFNVAEARERATRGASVGLLSMQERANLVHGRLEIDSVIGQGTTIRTWFPLTPET